MAKQGIGTGSSPNDGTGDNLRDVGGKINDNFTELYNFFGDGTNLSLNDLNVSGGINVSGVVTAATFSGTATTATTATNVTVTANNSANETVYPVFVDGTTGSQGAETDSGLTYNPLSGSLTATRFAIGDSNVQLYRSDDDLRIFVSGSNDLNTFANVTTMKAGSNADKTALKLTSSGAAELYYDSVKKLETRTDGIRVSGIVTAISGIVTYYGDGSNLSGISGVGGITVQDEGSALSTTATTLNFVGSNVVASGTGATKTITISGVGGITVQDEGSALSTTATTLNFVGSNVVASGTGATKTITISGGGGGGGGISTSRTNVSGTTGSVGAAATTDLSITAFKSYGILKVGISSAAWVRLYVDAASRTSDSSRSYLVDPTAGSGLIAEVRTETAGISTFLMTPGVIGWNNNSTPASTIYAAVTNNESSTAAITVTLSVVKLED